MKEKLDVVCLNETNLKSDIDTASLNLPIVTFIRRDYIKKKVSKRIGAMYRSKNLLPLKFRKMFANALMLPHFDYLDTIWSRTFKKPLGELDIMYKKVAKIALDVNTRERSVEVYKNMGWLPLHLRRQVHLSSYMYCSSSFTYPYIYRIFISNYPEKLTVGHCNMQGGLTDMI